GEKSHPHPFFPQLFAGDARAFGHRFKLGPADLWITDSWSEAAVRSGHDIFTANDFGIAHEPVRDRSRMLDDIGGVADDAGHEYLSRGQLHFFPNAPLVFVARIGSLDGDRIGLHLQDEIDDVP